MTTGQQAKGPVDKYRPKELELKNVKLVRLLRMHTCAAARLQVLVRVTVM